MKGVILAGGYGTRLQPLTRVINKHLLPVYDRPMIYYPIECLVNAGIRDIMIVTGGNQAGAFLELLGNGEAFGLNRLHYAYQPEAGGIAQALALARSFARGDRLAVVLGDNLIQGHIRHAADRFAAQPAGAKVLLKPVPDPHRFGVAELDERGRIVAIHEKPARPRSNLAVVGIYFYDQAVFDIIDTLEPSRRGELEITDVNTAYLRRGVLTADALEGWWTDAGTVPALHHAAQLVARYGANQVEFEPGDDVDTEAALTGAAACALAADA